MVLQRQPSTDVSSRRSYSYPWIALIGILLLAGVLNLYKLGDESLWIDELYSVYDAQGLPATLSLERPFYYILLRGWMLLGTSDMWLRALSVLFNIGSVFLIYQLGRRIAGKSIGLISALLFALSPLVINFAQMIRMYAMATCLGLGGSLALTHALEQPTLVSMGWWTAARILMIGTTPLTATLLLADVVLIGWRFRQQRRILRTFALFLLVIAISFIPIAWTTIAQRTDLLSSESGASLQSDTSSINFISDLKLIFGKLRKFTAFPFPMPSKLIGLFYQIYTVALWCLLSIALVNWKRFSKIRWVLLWAVIPSICNLLADEGLFATDRYILFVLPYFLILVATGFVTVWRWRRTVAIALALIYIPAVCGGLFRYYTVSDRQDWRGMMRAVSAGERAGDRIILATHNPRKAPLALLHYYHGNNSISGLTSDTCRDASSLSNVQSTSSRIWLICGSDINASRLQQQLQSQFQIASHQQFTNWGFDRQNDYLHLFLLVRRYSSTDKG